MKISNERKQEILRRVNKGLEWQFEIYSWADMITDCLCIDFTLEEIEWAKENTGYNAYICE
jgi:hypothetical protein